MNSAPSPDVTLLLRSWHAGNPTALDELAPVVYGELKRLARRYSRGERSGQAVETASLVNEVFLRLVQGTDVSWQHRAHFFAVSATMMRRILVDRARARGTAKRGGSPVTVNLDDVALPASSRGPELIALDDALTELGEIDPRKSRIIELRFFGGLSVEETADVLGISGKTVTRDWNLARAWILRQIRQGE